MAKKSQGSKGTSNKRVAADIFTLTIAHNHSKQNKRYFFLLEPHKLIDDQNRGDKDISLMSEVDKDCKVLTSAINRSVEFLEYTSTLTRNKIYVVTSAGSQEEIDKKNKTLNSSKFTRNKDIRFLRYPRSVIAYIKGKDTGDTTIISVDGADNADGSFISMIDTKNDIVQRKKIVGDIANGYSSRVEAIAIENALRYATKCRDPENNRVIILSDNESTVQKMQNRCEALNIEIYYLPREINSEADRVSKKHNIIGSVSNKTISHALKCKSLSR